MILIHDTLTASPLTFSTINRPHPPTNSKAISNLPINRHGHAHQTATNIHLPTAQITTGHHIHIVPTPWSNCFNIPISGDGALA
eukprot:scaffold367_cov202-Alexandrium_tamarense.AAC.14